MKTLKILKYAAFLVVLFFLSCDSKDEQEDIFVYFSQSEQTLKPGVENAIVIPMNVFSNTKINENIEISYTVEGEGADQIEGASSGSIFIEKGYSAYTAYIKLAAKSDENANADLSLSIKLHSPSPRVIVGLGSTNKNKSLQLNVINDNLSCLVNLWKGSLSCQDIIYPSYSPSSCIGEVVEEECLNLKIKFNFWDDSSLPITLNLELGEMDDTTKTGAVILLDDYNVKGGDYEISFYKGDAGTYDANSGELSLVIGFSGYDIRGDEKYRFTLKK